MRLLLRAVSFQQRHAVNVRGRAAPADKPKNTFVFSARLQHLFICLNAALAVWEDGQQLKSSSLKIWGGNWSICAPAQTTKLPKEALLSSYTRVGVQYKHRHAQLQESHQIHVWSSSHQEVVNRQNQPHSKSWILYQGCYPGLQIQVLLSELQTCGRLVYLHKHILPCLCMTVSQLPCVHLHTGKRQCVSFQVSCVLIAWRECPPPARLLPWVGYQQLDFPCHSLHQKLCWTSPKEQPILMALVR